MDNRSFSKIWVVPIILVLLAGGILTWQYFGTLKEEAKAPGEITGGETAGWETYKNERYKYELKYPTDLKMLKEELEREGFSVETAPMIYWMFPEGNTPNIAKDVYVGVGDNIEKESLRDFFKYNPTFCKIEDEQSNFIRINCEMGDGRVRIIWSAYSRDDRVYAISLEIMGGTESLTGMDFSSEIKTYDLMLSTFRFLE